MIPKSSPVSWEELTGKRTTTVHKRDGGTEIINDDWKTADPPDRAFDYSWTGTTVFERKFKPTHPLTTKIAPTAASTKQQTVVELPAHQRTRSSIVTERPAEADLTVATEEVSPETEHFQPATDQQVSVDKLPEDTFSPDELALQARTVKTLPGPHEPTAQERATHELTHLPYRSWCTVCVQAKEKELQHRRQSTEKQPVIQLDYHFLTHTERDW